MAGAESFTWASFSGKAGETFEHYGIDRGLAFDMIVASAVLITISYIGGRKFRQNPDLEPDGDLNFSNALQSIVLAFKNFMEGIIGKEAEKFYPLVAGLFFFIFANNIISLVPGFNPPTDRLNTTIPLAISAFLVTHYVGLRCHGAGYVKHFLGPVWWLSWLIAPIEIVSHLVRPLSLGLRLFGNMTGDHKVVGVFFSILAFGLPLPFMGLGIMISFLQAFVFVLLTLVYISGSLEHAH